MKIGAKCKKVANSTPSVGSLEVKFYLAFTNRIVLTATKQLLEITATSAALRDRAARFYRHCS